MSQDIEEDLFLSLEKYYGKPRRSNKSKYKKKYKYKCRVCKYIRDYKKSWDRFSELFEKYSI